MTVKKGVLIWKKQKFISPQGTGVLDTKNIFWVTALLKKKRGECDHSVYTVDIGLAGVSKRFGAHVWYKDGEWSRQYFIF